MQEKTRRKLTPDQNRTLVWLTTPKAERTPKTLEELAEELGVNPSTVRRWRTKFDLDEIASEIAKGELVESLPDVLRALTEKAEAGSYEHIRLFLEVADNRKQRIAVTVEDRRSEAAEKHRNEEG